MHPSESTGDDANANASLLSLGLPAMDNAGANGKAKRAKGMMIEQIRYIDYRYYRFLLHPEGEFRMVR